MVVMGMTWPRVGLHSRGCYHRRRRYVVPCMHAACGNRTRVHRYGSLMPRALGRRLFTQNSCCTEQVLTNAGWALSWAAVGGINRPHNSSISLGMEARLVDRAQLAKGLDVMARATELMQRAAEQDPEMASVLSTLLIEVGKFQLIFDSDGNPRDVMGNMTQRARAWIEKANATFLLSDRGPCLDCEVSIRQLEEKLGKRRAMDISGTSVETVASDSAGRQEAFSAQMDYTGVSVTPDWVPDVST
jgi:hypothetical protein